MEDNKIDIAVIQKPEYIKYDCPICEDEIHIDYKEFLGIVGDVCDWNYSKFFCPKCGKNFKSIVTNGCNK